MWATETRRERKLQYGRYGSDNKNVPQSNFDHHMDIIFPGLYFKGNLNVEQAGPIAT